MGCSLMVRVGRLLVGRYIITLTTPFADGAR